MVRSWLLASDLEKERERERSRSIIRRSCLASASSHRSLIPSVLPSRQGRKVEQHNTEMAASYDARRLEAGGGGGDNISLIKGNGSTGVLISKEIRHGHSHGRTAHNMSSSSLRKKSDLTLVSKVRCGLLRNFLANLQEIFLGTKLFILFPAVPLAVVAEYFNFGRVSILNN